MSNSRLKEIILGIIGLLSLATVYIVMLRWHNEILEIYNKYEDKIKKAKVDRKHKWSDIPFQNKKYIKLVKRES